jgi:hypothetical protein
MQTTMIVGGAVAGMAAISLVAGVGTVELSQSLLDPVPMRQLVINDLEYRNGQIVQNIGPTKGSGVDGIRASWTASVKRNEYIICGPGTGSGNYRGLTTVFTPAEWTDDPQCPDKLRPGDEASATWEYRRSDGLVVSVTGTIKVWPDPDAPIVSSIGN